MKKKYRPAPPKPSAIYSTRCNKLTYATRREAERMRSLRHRDGVRLYIYKHKKCNGYHLTHTREGKHKAR